MLYAHGWPKLASFSEKSGGFPDPLGIGSPASLTLAVFADNDITPRADAEIVAVLQQVRVVWFDEEIEHPRLFFLSVRSFEGGEVVVDNVFSVGSS